ncbi:MAG: hypothetical protein R3F30_06945 [Planctomycetota bacterium]
MNRRGDRAAAVLLGALLGAVTLCAVPAPAQGREGFTNFECPTVAPIRWVRLADRDYLLVCNTPDDSVEVWDAVGPTFVERVPVGLRPVSVHWEARLGRFYTCNMLGDSVSVVALTFDQRSQRPVARLERTEWVGDEPMMLAFAPDGRSVLVTLNSQQAVSWRDPLTLRPVVPGHSERIHLVDDFGNPGRAVRAPRAALVSGSVLHVLGFRGGDSFVHDVDLWSFDFATGKTTTLGGLGTIKPMMAMAANGDLWVLAWKAQNQLVGEPAVAGAPTGFTQSWVQRVSGLGGTAPQVVGRDLNTDGQGRPVPRPQALAMPTDLVLLEGSGGVEKVFFTAFGSDKLGVLEPKGANPQAWPLRVIPIPTTPGSRTVMAGPRGLALKPANPARPGDPGARLYVLDRIDQALCVVDPVGERVDKVVPLHQDPTPSYIKEARHFHYDAGLSGTGYVACASCHVDGRTDGRAWRLDAPPPAPPKPLPPALLDGMTAAEARTITAWDNAKGFLVTQSLQGLVNSETQQVCQDSFTNAPYHWRGDRDGFEEFNGAFVTLMRGRNLAGPGQPPRGLPPGEMGAYRGFIESIHHAPNPEQQLDRVYRGRASNAGTRDGSGAQLGLELFHEKRIVDLKTLVPEPGTAGRSCVECHALPEGSNNLLTRIGLTTRQPIETPTLRGLAIREARLELSPATLSGVVIDDFGLEHQGSLRSINDFVTFVFGHHFAQQDLPELYALIQFVREFDRGVAPLVGLAFTVEQGRTQGLGIVFDLFEGQAERAHAGLVVQAWLGAGRRGFVFEPELPGPNRYREVGGPGALLSRAQLLSLLVAAGDHLVVQATPLGEELRLAAVDGRARVPLGLAPSALSLEPARPMLAWRRVPSLTGNWTPGKGPSDFWWTGVYEGTSIPVPEPASLRSLRAMQYGMVQDGTNLGIKGLRHEAPRRLRVSGRDLRRGAQLVLFSPDDPTAPPPYRTPRPVRTLVLPLNPTGDLDGRGLPVWETSAELDPRQLYTLMLGGPRAPGVAAALAGTLPEPPLKGTFDPTRWNLHWLWVVNADGTFATGDWQPLRMD